jgi:DNA-3-methyladenine glycosylase I
MERCGWSTSDEHMQAYHDNEWGLPIHDDKKLFEFLVLEGAQAGLSWSTILKRREGYRRAFSDFDPQKVALYTQEDVSRLLSDTAIIRNRLKIASAITNAREFLRVQEEFGTFDRYIWQFVDGSPIQNSWTSLKEIPASTEISLAMSKDLKKRGFRFVGSTICYAHMQATGMVNDHLTSCFRYNEVKG